MFTTKRSKSISTYQISELPVDVDKLREFGATRVIAHCLCTAILDSL